MTASTFVPISGRWLHGALLEVITHRELHVFCGNLQYPDLLHHAIDTMSLYALPASMTSFDYRQREVRFQFLFSG